MQLSEIYEPREDSFFMSRYVLKLAKGNVLDMGAGSGIQAVTAKKKRSVKKVVGVDISKKSIEHCKKKYKKITWIQSNLFKNLGKKYHHFFDTIIFNAPYLPQKGKKQIKTIEGGKKGYETIIDFLDKAKDFLKPKGIIILLFSSFSRPDFILNHADQSLYSYSKPAIESLFFEELFIYVLKKSDSLLEIEKKGIKDLKYFDKGWRGLIHTGKYRNKKVAVKTKRKFSEAKQAIKKEIKWLNIVNKYGIGPEFVTNGGGFLAYNFIEGIAFDKFMKTASKAKIKKIILDILKQCLKLDLLKYNKEEMHRPFTNVIITGNAKPVLIVFEKMYKTKKPHNVTQFCQFLINRSNFFKQKKFKFTRSKVIEAAVSYKRDKKYFNDIVELIK